MTEKIDWEAGQYTSKDCATHEWPANSDWVCYLFGGDPDIWGIQWRPAKGHEPNWFWRWMQYLCFGNRWVYRPLDGQK